MTSFNSSNDSSSISTSEFEDFMEPSIPDNTSNAMMTPFSSFDSSDDSPETPIPENTSNIADRFIMIIDMARNFADNELLSEAVQCLATELPAAKDVLGIEHPLTLEIMNRLGRVYGDQRRLEEAAELLHEVLERRRQLLGWDDAKTLETIRDLAWTCGEQGDVAKQDAFCMTKQGLFMEARIMEEKCRTSLGQAEALYSILYNTRSRMLGADHYDTIQSVGNLAWIYGKQGYTGKAIELFTSVFPKLEEHLGEGDSRMVWAINNLAELYRENGQFMEAEVQYKKTLKIIENFGDKDCRVIIVEQNIASMYALQGRIEEAVGMLQRLMERTKLDMGEEHPQTLRSIDKLACLYSNEGMLMEGLSLHESLYVTRIKVLGEDHLDTIRSRRWIHHIQQRLGI